MRNIRLTEPRIPTANVDGARALAARIARLFLPKPRYKVSDWSDARAFVPPGNAEAGRYRSDRLPYQRAMLDDAVDTDVIETVWIIAGQMGKSQCMTNIIGYFIDYDPSGILYMRPTLDMAKYFSKNDLAPFIRYTPCLKHKVRSNRSRNSGNTLLNKEYDGGAITLAGANSVSALRGPRKRVILQDEFDAYEPNTEGDPIAQGDKRAETFHNAVKIKGTTPTVKGASRAETLWEQSDKQYWFCPCPKCGHWQTLKWAQVHFEFTEDEYKQRRQGEKSILEAIGDIFNGLAQPPPMVERVTGKDGVTRLRDTVRTSYVCENAQCGEHLTDSDRIEMILAGEWRATAPFRGIRGRHLNGIYRILGKKDAYASYLHEFVEEFLKAKKGGAFTLMVWTNTFLAEWWEEEREKIESSELLRRRENYVGVPDKVLLLTAGVDFQGDRAEIDVVGYAEGEESWGIQHKIIPGDPYQPKLWEELHNFLTTSVWKNFDGIEFRITAACLDSGWPTDEVYKFCKPRFAQRIYAIKGKNQLGQPIVGRISRANRRKCPVYLLGTDTAKRQIYGRLRMTEQGPGFMHYPRAAELGYDEEYFAQLTSEEMRVRYHKGFPIQEFILPEGRRNEGLDIRVYANAAMLILQPAWDALRGKVRTAEGKRTVKDYQLKPHTPAEGEKAETETPPAEPAKPPTAGPKKPIRPRRAGGWIKGWR